MSTCVQELEDYIRKLKQQNTELENCNEQLKQCMLDMELQMGQIEVWSRRYIDNQAKQQHDLLSQQPAKELALESYDSSLT